MTMLAAAPGHAILLRIGESTIRIRDTFELSLRIEERFGRLFDLAIRKRADWPLADLEEFYSVLVGGLGVESDELRAHISEIGLIKAWGEIESVFSVILNGWDALSEEAEASAAENPTRRKPVPKLGSKRKPKESPGEMSSEPQVSSASVPPISGGSLPSSSPPSGEQQPAGPDLLHGMAPEASNGALRQAPTT